MYGIPASTDLNFMAGMSLIQVCVGQNELILRFDEPVEIVVESDMFVHQGGVTAHERSDVILGLIGCLASPITSLFWREDGTIVLFLDERQARIELRDANADYESYTVYVKNDPMLVV